MTRLILALPLAAAIAAITAAATPAAAIEYPWCAQYGGTDQGGGRNCGFTTLDQCMATVSGIGGFCEHNLFYPGATAEPAPHHRRKAQR